MAVRRDGAWVRSQRIKAIHKMIQGVGEASLKKVLALCEYKHGLERTTARKYLKTLEDCGFIEIDESSDLIMEVTNEPNSRA